MSRSQTGTKQFSARFRAATIELLRERARRTRATQTELAERYIDEGLRTDEHPLISFRDGAAGRRPALVGTRHDVWQVVETIRQNENSLQGAADYLRIPLTHVTACAAYYAEFQDEIDEWIADARAEADRAESSWRRGQELFS
ncbi:MAG: hypothetical protein MSC30_10910 [Gaiellaceae bacterium MAG52_C11]|nr:hypothetical protein [Candidatus Gaiellasilicea maunaloa]